MENIAITATKRQLAGKQVNKLRKTGQLPAVLYGYNVENQAIEISEKDFAKAFKSAGETTLINLIVDGKSQPVLIHDVQHHYLNSRPIHVDFYAINMAEKIKVKVPLHFIGDAPAVKAMGGTLVRNLTEVEVECLPTNLPHAFEIDISSLETFENAIRVSDIKAGNNVTIMANLEEVVVTVAPPRTEEEMNALNEKVEMDVTTVEGVVKPEETPEASADSKDVKAEKKEGSAPAAKSAKKE